MSELDDLIAESATELIDSWDRKYRTPLARKNVPRLMRYTGDDLRLIRYQSRLQGGGMFKPSDWAMVSALLASEDSNG